MNPLVNALIKSLEFALSQACAEHEVEFSVRGAEEIYGEEGLGELSDYETLTTFEISTMDFDPCFSRFDMEECVKLLKQDLKPASEKLAKLKLDLL